MSLKLLGVFKATCFENFLRHTKNYGLNTASNVNCYGFGTAARHCRALSFQIFIFRTKCAVRRAKTTGICNGLWCFLAGSKARPWSFVVAAQSRTWRWRDLQRRHRRGPKSRSTITSRPESPERGRGPVGLMLRTSPLNSLA